MSQIRRFRRTENLYGASALLAALAGVLLRTSTQGAARSSLSSLTLADGSQECGRAGRGPLKEFPADDPKTVDQDL
jgi:hypothetical protein